MTMVLRLTVDDDGIEHTTTLPHQAAVDLAYLVGALAEGFPDTTSMGPIGDAFDALPLGCEECSAEVGRLCNSLDWLAGGPR